MAVLDAVEWEPCLLEPVQNRDLERTLRRAIGVVPPAARYFLDAPWLVRAFATINQVPLLHLSTEMAEMVELVVSQDNSCRYCYTATRNVMKIIGFPEARIRRLEDAFFGADLSQAERGVLDFARCVSRGSPLATCQDGSPLVSAGYSLDAVKEIAFFATASVFFNRVSTLPALPPAEVDLAGRWYVRLLRPLIARRIIRRHVSTQESLTPEQRLGPFAEFVNALDGLPAASRLRAVLDDAWGTTALSTRVKALVFAVIARGIGCQPGEREAVRLLTAAGMSADHVERALAHLSGPELDPLEQSAAALARESIWYRPAQLQRQARAIRAQFTREQFVELIGITALANAVCRLAVAVDVAQQAR
jgi:alkylhydroperoxidase family enzyme